MGPLNLYLWNFRNHERHLKIVECTRIDECGVLGDPRIPNVGVGGEAYIRKNLGEYGALRS
jgi:hypothetical protein